MHVVLRVLERGIPRVEPAHVVITLHATVHNGGITLFSDTLSGNFMVDPVGKAPHGAIDFTKLDTAAGVVEDGVLEVLVKVTIVQEDIWVVPPSIEVALNRLDRLYDTIQLLIPGKNDKGSVRSGARGVDIQASGGKDFVMFFANTPVQKGQ